MLIVVRDPGEGFDPSALHDPLVGENLFFGHGGTEIYMRELPRKEEPVPGGGFWE
jgi:hypothetical protein